MLHLKPDGFQLKGFSAVYSARARVVDSGGFVRKERMGGDNQKYHLFRVEFVQ
jgi:hypothetical protein